jgi:hypothetical protein
MTSIPPPAGTHVKTPENPFLKLALEMGVPARDPVTGRALLPNAPAVAAAAAPAGGSEDAAQHPGAADPLV